MSIDHNAVIAAEARRVLKPQGLVQRGKSRVWIEDHGWWTIQVEFQPSAWSKGSYLNVGINWLLYEGGTGVFHIGYRVNVAFIDAAESRNFQDDAHTLALRAKEEVERLRSQFSTLDAAASYYRHSGCRSSWDHYYHGVLLALGGDIASAKVALESVSPRLVEFGWQKALIQRASELHALASDQAAFIKTMRGIVLRSRSIGNLPEWESELVFP